MKERHVDFLFIVFVVVFFSFFLGVHNRPEKEKECIAGGKVYFERKGVWHLAELKMIGENRVCP